MAFLLYHIQELKGLNAATVFNTAMYGLRMDASMAAYLSLPVCLFLLIAVWLGIFSSPKLYKVYSWLILLPVILIIFVDMPAYQAWGFRLDITPLKYLASPREAWASVSHLPVFWILLFILIMYVLAGRYFSKLIDKFSPAKEHANNRILSFSLLLLCTASLIIPLRGGLQLAPLNQSSVYFSKKPFANMAAINVTWNFMHSMTHRTGDNSNPYVFMDSRKADSLVAKLMHTTHSVDLLTDTTIQKPNVILIVWESLTAKAVNRKWNGVEVTPGFNRLMGEGIYFDEVYATGDRTDKGIVGVLSGYPAQPTSSIVKIPRKANALPNITTAFTRLGYETSFSYGGEPEFANMKAYLMGCGFTGFMSKDDFSKKDQNSKWGAHDHVVKDSLQLRLSKSKTPFFTAWLTLSSHEPYEIPVASTIKGTKDVDQFLNSIHYTDSVIYAFTAFCKKQSWWKNTLLVIIADHGHRLPYTGKRIDDFKIPLLILGGSLRQPGQVIHTTGSQTDLASTLLEQVGASSSAFTWSRNLLKNSRDPSAYFCFNNGFGFVQPGKYFIYDHAGKRITEQIGQITEQDLDKGKAMQQKTMDDYIAR